MLKRRRNWKHKKIKKVLQHFKNHRSKIEIKMQSILEEIGVPFMEEWRVPYKKSSKYYDFLVYRKDEHNQVAWRFAIECHGAFFHGLEYLEGRKTKDKLFKIQRKNLRNDATKKKILIELETPLLVFWEREINTKRDEIKSAIQNTISLLDDRIHNKQTIVLSESEIQSLIKIY